MSLQLITIFWTAKNGPFKAYQESVQLLYKHRHTDVTNQVDNEALYGLP